MKYDVGYSLQTALVMAIVYGVYVCRVFVLFVLFCLFVAYILLPCKKRVETYIGSGIATFFLTFGVFGWVCLSLWKTLVVWGNIVQHTSPITLPLWDEMLQWAEKMPGFSYEAWTQVAEKSLTLLIHGGWGVLFFLLTPFFVFFFLRRLEKWGPDLLAYASDISAEAPQRLRRVHESLSHYIKGQLLISMILGLYYTTGLTLLGVKSALTLGFLTGLGSFIPYLGFLYGLMMTLSLVAASKASLALIYSVLGLYGLGYVAESSFLFPYFVGRALGIPTVGMLSLVFISGTLFGFFGVVLAAPLAAVVKVLLLQTLKKS